MQFYGKRGEGTSSAATVRITNLVESREDDMHLRISSPYAKHANAWVRDMILPKHIHVVVNQFEYFVKTVISITIPLEFSQAFIVKIT